MVIIEKNLVHIFNLTDMKIIHTLETSSISIGNLVISSSSENENILCYSPYSDEGLIKVYDLIYLYFKFTIRAHKSQVGRLAINKKGDMVASCSEKGTIIRIFSTSTGEKLFTYKRGMMPTLIFNMNFNMQSDKIIVTSENGTIHIFNLTKKYSI